MLPFGYGPPVEVVVIGVVPSPKSMVKVPLASAVTLPIGVVVSRWSLTEAPVDRYALSETRENGGSKDGFGDGSCRDITSLTTVMSFTGFDGGELIVMLLSMQ